MNDGIALADVSEKLIAESFTFGSAFHQSCNVYNLTGSGHDTSRVHDFGELSESLVWHGNHAQVGFNRTEREVSSLCLGTGQAIEQSRLSHVW